MQPPGSEPSTPHLLKLSNTEELIFNFTCVIRQTEVLDDGSNNQEKVVKDDTTISGLTFLFASQASDLENLVTKEFHANPNLHKNPNVELVGDCSTNGNPSVQFQWSWKWKPPKQSEDRGGGWQNMCSVSYSTLLLQTAYNWT